MVMHWFHGNFTRKGVLGDVIGRDPKNAYLFCEENS
jgi:hypothetical protein